MAVKEEWELVRSTIKAGVKGADATKLVRLCKRLRLRLVLWGNELRRRAATSADEAIVPSNSNNIAQCFCLLYVHAAKAAGGCPKSALECRLEGLRVLGVYSCAIRREEICSRAIAASNAF